MNFRTALHLGILTSLGSLALLLVADLTEEARSENRRGALQRSLAELFDEDTRIDLDIDTSRLEHPVTICDGQASPRVTLVPGSSAGYAGDIAFVAAVDAAGQVTGVRVTSHAETPGIGDLVETRKSPWIHSLRSRSATRTDWRLVQDGGEIDGVSGATITLRGLLRGLDEVLVSDRPECSQ